MKWTTLRHNGLMFPEPYVPHNIPIQLNKSTIPISPLQEEFITYFVMLNDKYSKDDVLRKNFWKDWISLGPRNVFNEILNSPDPLSKLNLSAIQAHVDRTRAAKKEKASLLTKTEKQDIKDKKETIEEAYRWCWIDGKKEKIDNFRIEPPGIFIGRGCHPSMGRIKRRITPRHVTLNIDAQSPVPVFSMYGMSEPYGKVIHNQDVAWIASWHDAVANTTKYVYLSQESAIRGGNDCEKFDKARLLRKRIQKIRKINQENLLSSDEKTRQLATCCYLVDHLALRAGNEKGEDKADTVGVCSLRVEHITLYNDSVKLDFLGKDSIRYERKFKVEGVVLNCLNEFVSKHNNLPPRKRQKQMLFDLIDTRLLNKYLQEFMPCLTAKVFRTLNASNTMEKDLMRLPDRLLEPKVDPKEEAVRIESILLHYNQANAKVAHLCNHQKAVSANFDEGVKKMEDSINKKKEILKKHTNELAILQRERTDEKPLTEKQQKALKKKKQTLRERIKSVTQMISKQKLQVKSKKELKNISLSTSKVNYIDPRILVAFVKRTAIPMEKIFASKLQSKFRWAMEVGPDFKF